jgi:uncharacterized membrane protein YjjP (DUF1212 family)
MKQSNDSSSWPLIVFVFVVCIFISMLFGNGTNSTSSTSSTSTSAPDKSSFEYRYAKERVKQEGYSDREAAQAAEAIIKFHNAQKARGQ